MALEKIKENGTGKRVLIHKVYLPVEYNVKHVSTFDHVRKTTKNVFSEEEKSHVSSIV